MLTNYWLDRGGNFTEDTRISVFYFEPHYYELGGSEFHHVVGFAAFVLPGENPLKRGEMVMQKHE